MASSTSASSVRIGIVAGGTGGHIMPALALGKALGEQGAVVDYICGIRPVERQIYADHGIAPTVLGLGPITQGGLARRARQGWSLAVGLARCMGLVGRYDAVVGMGGYVSATVLPAAWLRGVPFVIHDSNAILGKVNRWMARRAARVACGLPLARVPGGLRPERIVQTGTPVRDGIGGEYSAEARIRACATFGVEPEGFTLLLLGGSQGGSRAYAGLLTDMLIALDRDWGHSRPVQVIWAMGAQNLPQVEEALAGAGFRGRRWLGAGIQDMGSAYRAADLFVGRAGGSSLAEVLVCGLPSVLLPLPISAERHQYHNAEVLARAGAAEVFDERQGSADDLAKRIGALAGEPAQLQRMSKAAFHLARPDAADALARMVFAVARRAERG